MKFEGACAARSRGEDADALRLNPESRESLDAFREMAKLGLLTMDSQEGLVAKVKNGCKDIALWQRVIEDDPETEKQRQSDRVSKAKMAKWSREYRDRGGSRGDGVTYEKAYLWGTMLKERAVRVCDTFNMLTDKIALVVNDVKDDDADAYPIPVTFTRFDDGQLLRHTSAYAWVGRRTHAFEVGDQGLGAKEARRVSMVVFVDPTPGRQARGDNGLYGDVLRALKYDK